MASGTGLDTHALNPRSALQAFAARVLPRDREPRRSHGAAAALLRLLTGAGETQALHYRFHLFATRVVRTDPRRVKERKAKILNIPCDAVVAWFLVASCLERDKQLLARGTWSVPAQPELRVVGRAGRGGEGS